MQSVNVIPFNFESREIRTLLINDQPWFVAVDVCQALEIRNNRDAISRLDEDERGVATTDTPSGRQAMGVINESGLYSLILTSRKATAKRFKKWVTAEVLPAIRKHGRYEDSDNRMETLIGQTIGTDGFHMLGAVVKGKVSSLPVPLRRRATAKIWAQTHAAFGVRSAADIPSDQLDSARNFIAAYALEGEWLPKRDTDIPESLSILERYMVYADHNGQRQIRAIPSDAYVLSQKDLIKGMVVTPGDILVSTEDMFEFAIAALVNLKARSEYQTKRINDLTAAGKHSAVKT